MEQPFLFTDLIPPDELSALDNSKLEQELKEGSIPIKTWTNGSPFRLPLSFRPDLDLKPAAKTHSASASTDGMMNYTYSEGMHRLEAEDEDTGYCEGDNSTTDQLYQDDASMGNDEYNHDSMEDDEYIRDDEIDPDEDDRGDADVDDDNDYLMDSYDDYEDSVLRSSSSRGTSGVQMNISGFDRLNESNDEPNIADVDDYELVHRDETGDELHEEWESFSAVALSREETAFLSDSVGSDDATDEQIQDLVAIMNEYNELVQYMNSPRKSISKADTSSSSAAFIAGESPRSRWKGSDGIEDGQSSRRSLPRGTQEAILSALADQHQQQQQPRVLEGQILRRKKQQQQKKKKTKLFGYAREQQQQLAIQQKIAYNNNIGGGAAIDDKQRAILADIVEKRKKEEEDAARAAEKALQKRRKFKEALLEKALRAREQQQEKAAAAAEIAAAAEEAPMDHRHQQQQQRARSKVDTTPMFPAINNGGGKKGKKDQQPSSVTPSAGFLAPTKSFQVVMESAKANALPTPADLTEEDAARAEEERREHVASIRRKFKEQHKQILQALQSKHKEDERKAVEEQIKDAVRKEKYRLKLMRMIAEKQGKEEQLLQAATAAATAAASLSSDGGGAPPIDDAMEPRKPSQQQRLVLPSILRTKSQHTNEEEEVDIDHDNRLAHCKQQAPKSAAGSSVSSGEVAAGSALSAIRRRFRSKSATAAPECELKPVAEESQLIDNDTGGGKQQPIRSVVSKEQQEKLASYLHTLSEQRRKEEQDRKKEEDRMRRRAALLSARLLQEAADRKLLLAEGGGVVQESKQSNDDDSDEQQQQEAAVSGVLASTPVKGSHKPTAKSNGRKHLTESISEVTPAAADHCCTTSSPGTEKKKVKFTQDMADKVVSRLHASKADHQADADKENNNINSAGTLISGCNVPVRDFADWKRKNSVPSDAMVFSMTGWYPCVRDALLGRGWVQNPDINSPHAHLKWTLRSIDVNHDSLQPWQLTNHFAKNVAITTKVGLLKSLQSLVWLADVDVDAILPRGYDLSSPVDMQAFIDDFRCQRAEGLLKGIYHRITGLELPVLGRKQLSAVSEDGVLQPDTIQMDSYDQTHSSSNSRSCEEEEEEETLLPPTPPVQVGVALDSVRVNAAVFDATCSILEKYIRPLDDSYIDEKDINDAATKDITDLEWELISNYDLHSSFPSLPIVIPEPIDSFLREKVDPDAKLSQQQKWDRRRMQRIEQDLREAASTNLSVLRPLTSEDLQRIHIILCTLLRHNQCQTGLNGKGSNSLNMWIVKPAAKSRGRGIATFMDLSKLLKCVDAGTGRFSQWVVQKYVENPLVIAKRKFDLRQWVLVTNWNPLTIYFYDECYARFSVDEYSTEVCDLDNSYVHLVNNSIGKNSERFNDVVVAENGRKLDGFMWSFEHFSEYVTFKSGQDLVKSKIHPRMKDIAKWSLMCASEMIEHRKNSWELYGFDFMVDDEYNAWLIEINSSPACDYSTTVTERYVQKALVELLSVVLDCREWEAQPKKTRGPSPDTGGWERIYQGPLLEIPVGSFGTEMSLKGEAFKHLPPAGRTNGSHVHNFSFTRSVSDDADRATDDAEVPSERTSAHRVPAEGDRRSSKHTGIKSLGGSSSSSYNPVKSSSSKARHEERSNEKVISEVVQVTDETERFDDSDDDDPKRISSSSKVAEIALKSPPPDTVVVGSTRRPTQLKPPSGRQPLSAAMASIPIKVFAVDF